MGTWWLLFAFSGPVFWALSTHIDKYLVDKYFRGSDPAVLMVFTAFVGLLMLPFIWVYQRHALLLPLESISVMIASGVMYMAAMLFYLRAIQSEDASVVAPLFQTSVIFTFLLSFVLLGERLSPIALGGVALIVLGALALSFNTRRRSARMRRRLVVPMLACTFILALSSVLFKYFAVQDEFWVTTFWTYVGEALFGLGILLVPHYFRQFRDLLKKNTGALLSLNASNELINLGGGLGVRFASLFAPIVVVSAISSTTTLFAFAFGILFTLLFPKIVHEDISAASILQKGFAAVVIMIGVLLANQ